MNGVKSRYRHQIAEESLMNEIGEENRRHDRHGHPGDPRSDSFRQGEQGQTDQGRGGAAEPQAGDRPSQTCAGQNPPLLDEDGSGTPHHIHY